MTAPQLSKPLAGFYKVRMARGGVFVPIHFWHGPSPDPDFPDNQQDRSPRWHCIRRGEEIESAAVIFELWTYAAGRPIDEQEYDYMLAVCRHVDTLDANSPHATPRKKIDLHKTAPLF